MAPIMSQKTTAAKKKATSQKKKMLRAATTSQRSVSHTTSSSPTSSRHLTVEESDNDNEPGHVGETLDTDGDAVMEEVDTGSARRLGDPIELSDIEEDDEGELSESTITVSVFQLLIKIGGAKTTHQEWTAPVYTFIKPTPVIKYVDGRHSHVFQCAAKMCKHKMRGVQRWIRVMRSRWVTCECMQRSVGVMKWLLLPMLPIMRMRYVQLQSKDS
jgi:hypothetical protein